MVAPTSQAARPTSQYSTRLEAHRQMVSPSATPRPSRPWGNNRVLPLATTDGIQTFKGVFSIAFHWCLEEQFHLLLREVKDFLNVLTKSDSYLLLFSIYWHTVAKTCRFPRSSRLSYLNLNILRKMTESPFFSYLYLNSQVTLTKSVASRKIVFRRSAQSGCVNC